MQKYYIVLGSIFFVSSAFADEVPDFRGFQQDIVAALSGADEISPNKYLRERASKSGKDYSKKFLIDQIKKLGITPQTQNYGSGENIYGVIPGTKNSNQSVVIGAHFDTVSNSPGANDNATGIALALAVAQFIKSNKCRKHSLIIAFFDEEEKGLIGSQYFAKLLVSQKNDIHSVHTFDQMGWDNDGDRAIELELPSRKMFDLYSRVAKQTGFNANIYKTRTSSTDHRSFRKLGFEAVGITEEYVHGDTTPHYHRSSDTFDTVNFDYLESTTLLLNNVFREILVEGC